MGQVSGCSRNRKINGFTLVELLAVIVVLSLLLIIAVPAINEVVNSSKKRVFLATAEQYVEAVTVKINTREFNFNNSNIAYYVPVSNIPLNSCVELDAGGASPYGKWDRAYVIVTYYNNSYTYYFTAKDIEGYGMHPKEVGKWTVNDVLKDSDVTFPTSLSNVNLNGKIYLASVYDASNCYNSSTDSNLVKVDESQWVFNVENKSITTFKGFGSSPVNSGLIVPNKIGEYDVKSFDAWQTFSGVDKNTQNPYYSSLKRIIIEDGIADINGVFQDTDANIQEIIFPNTLKTIGGQTFQNATLKLSSLIIPDSVTEIKDQSFEESNLGITSITIPEGVTSIGYNSFSNAKISKIFLPSTIKSIGWAAFNNPNGYITEISVNMTKSQFEAMLKTNNAFATIDDLVNYGDTSIFKFK